MNPLLPNITTSYNDTTFYFLRGTYNLLNTITFYHSINLQFQGEGEMTKVHAVMEPPVVIIDCFTNKSPAAISFNNCINVSLTNITFKSCRNITRSALYFNEPSNISMEHMSFQNYVHTAALYLQSSFNYTIIHSSFYNNSLAIVIELQPRATEYQGWANIKMKWLFIEGSYDTGILFNINGISQNNIQLDHVVVTKSSFGLQILAHSKQSHIAITNSSFYNNYQTGIRLEVADNTSGTFLLDSSRFNNNSGIFGTSLQAVIYGTIIQNFNISINKVAFANNKVNQKFVDNYDISENYAMTVGIANCISIVISECTFSNNEGSGLALFNSRVKFYGVNIFSNNTAYRGGGIVMVANSLPSASAWYVGLSWTIAAPKWPPPQQH